MRGEREGRVGFKPVGVPGVLPEPGDKVEVAALGGAPTLREGEGEGVREAVDVVEGEDPVEREGVGVGVEEGDAPRVSEEVGAEVRVEVVEMEEEEELLITVDELSEGLEDGVKVALGVEENTVEDVVEGLAPVDKEEVGVPERVGVAVGL